MVMQTNFTSLYQGEMYEYGKQPTSPVRFETGERLKKKQVVSRKHLESYFV